MSGKTIEEHLNAIEYLTEQMHLHQVIDNWVLIKWNLGEVRKLLAALRGA